MTKGSRENSMLIFHPEAGEKPVQRSIETGKTRRATNPIQQQSANGPSSKGDAAQLHPDCDPSKVETAMGLDPVEAEIRKPMQGGEADVIMTPDEGARYLRISVATLLRGSRLGEIPGFHVGKLWRYRKSALDDWMQSKVSFFRHPCRK
jgi:excisionase family DNA binding protein